MSRRLHGRRVSIYVIFTIRAQSTNTRNHYPRSLKPDRDGAGCIARSVPCARLRPRRVHNRERRSEWERELCPPAVPQGAARRIQPIPPVGRLPGRAAHAIVMERSKWRIGCAHALRVERPAAVRKGAAPQAWQQAHNIR
eukprot:4872854-Prymnesium_polylepis.2